MTPERWQRIDRLFESCLALSEPARRELLARECEGDVDLLGIVQGMLDADGTAGDPLKDAVNACAEEVATQPGDHWHGRVLGAYRVEKLLGAGGMGTVFLASRSDSEYERRVAIKVLSNSFASLDERRRLLSERQILANLAHPNIAQLLDGGTTTEGAPYLVMEYIEGVPIDEYCITNKLNLKERMGLFLRVCDAVQYAHQNLVIHRDIKPGNILVTTDGTPKLLDFGIAKLIDPNALSRTVAATRLLTPRHASPEQIRGQQVTTASDVYSLGVLLFRLLTDRYPYAVQGESVSEVERAILETAPQRPSALRREIAGDLDTVVLTALRKEPERRYATVRELAHDVNAFLTLRPISARPESTGYRLRKFVERHVAGVIATAATATAIIALVTFYTLRLAEERDLQVRERATAERVSQFMVDIFKVADPGSGRKDVTARELLDHGSANISQELKEQPLVAASLLAAMGRAYGGLAMYDRSAELLRQSVALRERRLGPDDPLVAEARSHLGYALSERADYAGGRAELKKALTIQRTHIGSDPLAVGKTLASLAFIDMRESKYPEMRAAVQESLQIHLQHAGPDDPRTADVYALLGSYHWSVGENQQAHDAASRALAIEERIQPPNNARVAAFVHNLGLINWSMGEYPRAHDLYRRELALREKLYGPEHPNVALTLYGLGVTSKEMGNYREGLAFYRRAVAIQEKVFGPDNHYLAMTLGGQGFVLLEMQSFPSARESLSRAIAIFEARNGSSHPDLRAPLAGLAKVAIAEGRFEEARALLERALTIVQAKFAPDHPDVLRTRISLGGVFRASGEYKKALEYFEPSLAALQRTLGLEHPYAADALCGIADTLTHLGELERAKEHYKIARANLAAQKYSARRIAMAECLEGHAALLREVGDAAQAVEAETRARQVRDWVRASAGAATTAGMSTDRR